MGASSGRSESSNSSTVLSIAEASIAPSRIIRSGS
jgi:hypothetical protein